MKKHTRSTIRECEDISQKLISLVYQVAEDRIANLTRPSSLKEKVLTSSALATHKSIEAFFAVVRILE